MVQAGHADLLGGNPSSWWCTLNSHRPGTVSDDLHAVGELLSSLEVANFHFCGHRYSNPRGGRANGQRRRVAREPPPAQRPCSAILARLRREVGASAGRRIDGEEIQGEVVTDSAPFEIRLLQRPQRVEPIRPLGRGQRLQRGYLLDGERAI